LGPDELGRALSKSIKDIGLKINGWSRDGTGVISETALDLCEAGHTDSLVSCLSGMCRDVLSLEWTVKVLLAKLFVLTIPLMAQDGLGDLLLPVINLARDEEEAVKIVATEALCVMVKCLGESQGRVTGQITEHFEEVLAESVRPTQHGLVTFFAKMIPGAPKAMRDDFILGSLVKLARENAECRGLAMRKEMATALFDAFRAFDSVYLSEDQVIGELLPGLKTLLMDESLLDSFTLEVVRNKVEEIITAHPVPEEEAAPGPVEEPVEEAPKSSSAWTLDNFGGKLERSMKKKLAAAEALVPGAAP